MNAHREVEKQHPHFVAIPEAQAEGVRSYREPEVPHPLQLTFLDEAGERVWVEEIRSLLSAGRSAEAEAVLASALADFDGSLARLCKSIPASEVILDGWDDLLPILEEWEGPEITAVTLGLTNPADLVFEPGKSVEPELLIGLYSDEAFPFSRSSKAAIVEECMKDMPGWIGAEEDVEFYCEMRGLADLNTALIHCKHRYFLRDGRDGVAGRAPGGYVEFVLGCWFLATRFLQATERALATHKLSKGCRLVVGTVETGSDFLHVFGPDKAARSPAHSAGEAEQPSLATLTVKPWVPREDPTEPVAASPSTLRQRLRPTETEVENAPSPSFLARIFARFRRP
jgi:hypothetical protein